MWDLSSPTRDRACVLCVASRILNHWTTREAPLPTLLTSIAQLPPKHRRESLLYLFTFMFFFFNEEELPII